MLKKLLVLKWNVLNAIKKSKDGNKNNKGLFSQEKQLWRTLFQSLISRSHFLESQSCYSARSSQIVPSSDSSENVVKALKIVVFLNYYSHIITFSANLKSRDIITVSQPF